MCRTSASHTCLVGVLDVHTEAELLQNPPLRFDHLSLRIDISGVQWQRWACSVNQTEEVHRRAQVLRETLMTY